MNKAKRDSEIQNAISYLLSGELNEYQTNLAIQGICNKYSEEQVKKLSLGVVIQQSEQLVCKNCGTIPVRNEGDWCNKCIDEGF